MRPAVLTLLAAGLLLSACARDTGLRRLDAGLAGPDEFQVLPTLPLQLPGTTALPPPVTGVSNRVDANPDAQVAAALGGTQAAAFAGGIPARDAALVAAAGGTDPAIRSTLAQEDAALRSRAGTFNMFNWLGRDRYFRAYRGQALDARAELARFRAAGVQTPTAPPAE